MKSAAQSCQNSQNENRRVRIAEKRRRNPYVAFTCRKLGRLNELLDKCGSISVRLYGSSPANVLANYGELEKSGRFFPEVLRLGLTGSSSLISETASTFLNTTPCINETYKPGRRCMRCMPYSTTFQSGRISHLPMRQWHGCGEKQKAGRRKTSLSACRAKCSFSATGIAGDDCSEGKTLKGVEALFNWTSSQSWRSLRASLISFRRSGCRELLPATACRRNK